MARPLRRRTPKLKEKRLYMLLPAQQRKVIPVDDVIFTRSEVVETDKNLEHWVGILIQHAPDNAPAPAVALAPKPSEVPTQEAPAETKAEAKRRKAAEKRAEKAAEKKAAAEAKAAEGESGEWDGPDGSDEE